MNLGKFGEIWERILGISQILVNFPNFQKKCAISQFLESRGIRSHFSTPKERWHNGAAESTINSIMMSARTVMAESGLGGRFWFKAA